ncbi:hypothetical protein K493DRAFT_334165 [Basidiobolus meristosporus CBS 931.73]|uniref:SCP domain-containing protein n=1 Tax=Basidiobolus meristosporus CBS 931.73 TaxID=1314790 RepID=A0A1Y1Z1H8_9FUNG|nr:hypothetical protein K493DRAFT_334165 [Basidiobolus meristosporus CBS 931.73]|eukprot:ORY03695.1 hypothetical protein K493DRAFT_334165 [Basidiobolus meristosporus CBS 931.73]
MQPSFLLLVSAIASLQAISTTPLGGSQAPSQESQPSIEEVDDSEMSGPMQMSQISGEQPGLSGLQGFDISNLQPSQALLDNINGHSSSKANALSNSSIFDQAQVIDQTLYQPRQQQPQIIITQSAARALRGGYKKYKRSARRHFKDTRISTSILQKIKTKAIQYTYKVWSCPQIRYSLHLRFNTVAVSVGLTANQVAVAAPIGGSSQCTREYRRVHYRSLTCVQYANDYYQKVRVFPVFKAPNVQSALLRQVLTTVTRKHDSLNIANANSNQGFSIKYQAGPSLELEGRGNALEYAKQKGAEHSDDSSSHPYVLMQPTQDVLYTTPVIETQCVKEQNIQYTHCADNCA